MRNAIVYTPAKFAPLPGEITNERVNAAILPAQIEAATRAIALCESLPQLLVYREQAEGLAAAVKIMKKTAPDMVRAANNMVADAWRKGGELLLRYNGACVRIGKGGSGKSERRVAAEKLGLRETEITCLTRLANAPVEKVREVSQKTSSLLRAAASVQTRRVSGPAAKSQAYHRVMGSYKGSRLSEACSGIRAVDLTDVRALDASEKKLVRAKVTEIMELLDAIDEACK